MRRLLLLALLALAPTAAGAAEAPARRDGVRYLYLVRHGMYDRVESADDRTANGLNALGHEQARLVAARLAALPVRPARLVTSDFRRARETADEIGRVIRMEPAVDSLLRECAPGSDAGEADAGTRACEANLAAAWARYARPSTGADTHEVLVCHGNVIRWFAGRTLGAARRWRAMDIANASLTVIAIRPDGSTRLVIFSDVGHLPVAKQTWAGGGAGWGAPRDR